MKKTTSTFIFCIALMCSKATVFTVSNNTNLPGSPGQYTSINTAISAANNGDTIMIQSSPIAYTEATNIVVNKGLTFIGAGYNPQTIPTYNSTITSNISLSNGASNTKFIGLKFNGSIVFTNTFDVSNFSFIRCHFTNSLALHNGLPFSTNRVMGVLLVENCIATGSVISIAHYPATIRNCIFSGSAYINAYSSVSINNGTVPATHIIKNNLFLCAGYSVYDIQNSVIENNIMYSNVNGFVSVSNNTFNNNYLYGTQTLPPAGNIGGANIVSQNFVYTNTTTTCTFTYNDNYRPVAGTAVVNAGTDGTDIGPTGGIAPIYKYPAPYPLTGEPAIPQVREIIMPVSSVPAAGTLNINVKARKRD